MSSLFDPGKKARHAAQQAAMEGRLMGGGFSGPGGISGNWDFSGNQASGGFDLGMWADPQQQLINQSFGMLGQLGGFTPQAVNPGMYGGAFTPFGMAQSPNFMMGAGPYQNAMNAYSNQLAGMQGPQAGNMFGMGQMGQNFAQNLQTAGTDPSVLGQGYANMLHQSAAGDENRATRNFIEQTYGKNRGATTGAVEGLALHDKILNENRSKRDLMGLQFGQGQQQFAQQQLMPSFQAMNQQLGRQFTEGFQNFGQQARNLQAAGGMLSDAFGQMTPRLNAMGQFGMQNQQQLMDQFYKTGQLGMGMYGQGIQADQLGLQQQQILGSIAPQMMQQAIAMNQIPLDYQDAMLRAATASSNSYGQAADMQMQAAKQKPSAGLEALKMAGSIATGIPGFGGFNPFGAGSMPTFPTMSGLGGYNGGAAPSMSSLAGFGGFGQAAQIGFQPFGGNYGFQNLQLMPTF